LPIGRGSGAQDSRDAARRDFDGHPPAPLSGIECTSRLKALLPATPIVILTVLDDDELIFRAFASRRGWVFAQAFQTAEVARGAVGRAERGRADEQRHRTAGRALVPASAGQSAQ